MRAMDTKNNIQTCFFILIILCSVSVAKTIYVDDDANGANDGSSWENAYVYLQEALADANDLVKPVEIHVAQGTYKPDGGIVAIPEFDWRTLTFQLISGVSLKGGYAGVTSPDPNARDIELYETILSGDLKNNDINITDPCDLLLEPTRDENSYHIVTSVGTDNTCVLDGFTITGGNANGDYQMLYQGGGIYNQNIPSDHWECTFSGPIISKCRIILNSAAGEGGGMYNQYSCQPKILNCSFINNMALWDGGGMKNDASHPLVTNCLFENNFAGGDLDTSFGGGMDNEGGSPTLTNCIFIANTANLGGAVSNCWCDCNPIFVNCTFSNNSAEYGGALWISNHMGENGSNLKLTNCTIVGNSADYGNAIACIKEIPDIGSTQSNIIFANCIIWDGGNEIFNDNESIIEVSYSNIQDGQNSINDPCELVIWNEGNIDVEPLFADPNNGDYHLKSETGRWDPNSGSWVVDDVTSPCIDAGDPNSDWTGETWPHGERINMGAYGGTPEASMSTRPEEMSLPKIAYIYESNSQVAESFRAFLTGYGCETTLIKLNEVSATSFDSYELIIVTNDTDSVSTWEESGAVTAIEDSDKPIVGLGDGGYYFFGELDLSIGSPNGGHSSAHSITVLDPDLPLFSSPYPIDVPDDRILQLYTETETVSIYLWPEPPETVTVLAQEANSTGYYPLVIEHDRYLLWGFTESPQKMTEVGRQLFINVIIRTANSAW